MSTDQTHQAKAERVQEMQRRAVETIERRDREAAERHVAEFWHEDCEWTPLIAGVEGPSTYRGRKGVLRFFDDFLASFDVEYRDVEVRQIGDAVVFMSNVHLRGLESGIEVEREVGAIYVFDGDLIRWGRAYDSHAAALAAAEAVNA